MANARLVASTLAIPLPAISNARRFARFDRDLHAYRRSNVRVADNLCCHFRLSRQRHRAVFFQGGDIVGRKSQLAEYLTAVLAKQRRAAAYLAGRLGKFHR